MPPIGQHNTPAKLTTALPTRRRAVTTPRATSALLSELHHHTRGARPAQPRHGGSDSSPAEVPPVVSSVV
ncbi:Chitin synthase G [Alternaria alternata]|nr:Chitin synthase G [Alternaria alternata]